MLKKVLIGIFVIVVILFVVASRQPDEFSYERSGLINAPASAIYPYVSDLRKGDEWSPYEKKDPNMKISYIGPESGVGSIMEFSGSNEVGSGRLEIKKAIPNEMVELELQMSEPMEATNTIRYTLTPDGDGTRFTWTMQGKANFFFKILGLFIDCEKMVTEDFTKGIQNLKTLVESQS